MNSSADLLIFRSLGRVCGLPPEHVEETMRPLPVQPLPGVEGYVVGVSIIRGKPCPIVDLRQFFEGSPGSEPPRRLVAVRVDEHRRVALLVDEVLGLRTVSLSSTDQLPPLLRSANSNAIESLRILDGQLLGVLARGQLIPEDVWVRAAQVGAAS